MSNELQSLIDSMNPQQKHPVMPIRAIWLGKSIMMSDGNRKIRITKDDRVYVFNGKLADCPDGIATHIVVDVFGNIDSSTLYLQLKDITSGNVFPLYVNGGDINGELNNE